MRFIKLLLPTLLSLFVSPLHADINNHFTAIKSDPNALYTFLKDMPKGGELHYHLAGGAYPETMLSLAAKDDFCVDKTTATITKNKDTCNGANVADVAAKPALYDETIRAWSMKGFIPGRESGHDHFFAAFFKFMPVISAYQPQLLAEVMKRAANQHELYMEIMILPDNAQSASFAKLIENTTNTADKRQSLLTNKAFQKNTALTISESKRTLKQAHKHLGCDNVPNQPVCALSVKFQYFILREQPLNNFFAQALNGFAAAAQSPDIVAINMVQAEDGPISLRDYRAQMQVIKFMHETYPEVHITLHAGELSSAAVNPNHLRYHIHDAIFTAHAERIGHGVDIAHEDGSEALLNHMAKNQIAVEINLTSNRKILAIAGKDHPLQSYLSHQVPVVLSTDDEGILRTDLTHQYVDAAINHDLDYATIKGINRNALTYSFLPGNSLWADAGKYIPVQACKLLNSKSCQLFIAGNDKAKLQWQLEIKLIAFEKQYQGHKQEN